MWNSVGEPILELEVRARNDGDSALDRLSLGLTLWPPVRSRSAYELSLADDPTAAAPVLAEPRPQDGTLEPGEARVFSLQLDLSPLADLTEQSLVYPLRVDLRSGISSVAVLRTPVVFIVKTPETPLELAWTVVLDEPILFAQIGRASCRERV